MGLKLASVKLLLPAIEATRGKRDARVLLLGKQDCYFSYDQVTALLTKTGIAIESVPASERVLTDSFAFVAHEDWWKYRNFLHQKTFFRLFGFKDEQIDSMDVSGYEHANIIHDMNNPLTLGNPGYDLVIDAGTLEHVFNVQQALWNICDLVRSGGRIVHIMPANMLDHGFYNFNSTLLADFYAQAGWTEEELVYIASPVKDIGARVIYVRIEPGKLEVPPGDFYLGLLGRFQKPNSATTKPVARQGLYVNLHDAWTRQSRDQSVHVAPPQSRAWLMRLVSRFKATLSFYRAQFAARRLGGELITFEEPLDDAR